MKWKLRGAYALLFVGSAAVSGWFLAPSFGGDAPAARAKPPFQVGDDYQNARLAAQAWAGAVETGDVDVACAATSTLVRDCRAQMTQYARVLAGKGAFKIGPAEHVKDGVYGVACAFVSAGGAREATIFVRSERGGFRFVGLKV